jgi:hypothetical protein
MAMHRTTLSPKCCCPALAKLLQLSDAWHPYCDLQNQLLAAIVGGQGIENGRKLLRVELDVHDGTNDCQMCQYESQIEVSDRVEKFLGRVSAAWERAGSLTLMDLPVLRSIGRCEPR